MHGTGFHKHPGKGACHEHATSMTAAGLDVALIYGYHICNGEKLFTRYLGGTLATMEPML